MLKFPIIYCAVCKKCRSRTFKNLFNTKAAIDCGDGFSIKIVLPGLLWKVKWCKLYWEEEKK